nr:Transposon Ty3-I Gag-Pol polyprotein [Ipomoea batatas]
MPKLSLASQKSPKSKEIKEYGDIFPKEMREGLPPMRDKEHQIDLVSKASLLNRPPYRYGAKKAKWVWAIYEQVSRQINDNAYKLALQGKCGVSITFNVVDLSPFDADPEDSWTNLPKNWEMLRPAMVARLEVHYMFWMVI